MTPIEYLLAEASIRYPDAQLAPLVLRGPLDAILICDDEQRHAFGRWLRHALCRGIDASDRLLNEAARHGAANLVRAAMAADPRLNITDLALLGAHTCLLRTLPSADREAHQLCAWAWCQWALYHAEPAWLASIAEHSDRVAESLRQDPELGARAKSFLVEAVLGCGAWALVALAAEERGEEVQGYYGDRAFQPRGRMDVLSISRDDEGRLGLADEVIVRAWNDHLSTIRLVVRTIDGLDPTAIISGGSAAPTRPQ